MQDDRWGHTTDQDIEELARALRANYPRFISPADVRNAWDWFRIYGEADWAAKAVVAKRDLADLDSDEFWYRQDWQQAQVRLDDALFQVVSPCLPEGPSSRCPSVFSTPSVSSPARRFYFVNRRRPRANGRGRDASARLILELLRRKRGKGPLFCSRAAFGHAAAPAALPSN